MFAKTGVFKKYGTTHTHTLSSLDAELQDIDTHTGSEDEDQVVMKIMLLQPLVNHVIVSDLMARLDLYAILILLKHTEVDC